MASQLWIWLFALAFLKTTCSLKLGDVFDVYVEEDEHGSCKEYYDANNPQSVLEKWWGEINRLNHIGNIAVAGYERASNQATRNMARVMFGIMWGDGEKAPDPNGKEEYLDAERLRVVRDRFSKMNIFLNTPQLPSRKPRLLCDTTYERLMRPDDPMIDVATGKYVPKDPARPRGPFKTMRDDPQFDMNRYWYYYMDLPKVGGHTNTRERLYNPVEKTGPFPYPLNSDGNRPSQCLGNVEGVTTHRVGSNAHVVVCVEKVQQFQNKIPELPTHLGAWLHQVNPQSLSFYHELWHLVFGTDNTRDPPVLACLAKKPGIRAAFVGNPEGDAPHFYKWPQDFRSWGYDPSWKGSGPLTTALTALYDRCTEGPRLQTHVELKDAGILAVHSPESYVWFTIGMWLRANTAHDWSSGLARPLGSPYVGVEDNPSPWIPQDVPLLMAAGHS